MASGYSDAWAKLVQNCTLATPSGTNLVMPTLGLEVRLYSDACTAAAPGTEIAIGSYAPAPVTFADAIDSTNECANNADVEFPAATANWPTVVSFSVHQTSTGTYVAFGDLDSPAIVTSGDTLKFAAGNLKIRNNESP